MTDFSEKTESEDRGPWIHTWSGGKFYYLTPLPEEVLVRDIAHALSLQCRFNGHVEEHYSVAEHSVLVSDMAYNLSKDYKVALAGLLHDAAEAYIGDVVSPLKKMLSEYKEIEERVEKCIAEAFDLEFPWPEEVHRADKLILSREFSSIAPFAEEGEAYGTLSPKAAEARFMQRYVELMGAIDA